MNRSPTGLYLGVDGGGTHTVALASLRDGSVVGRGEAGAANPQAVGFEAAAEQLGAAVRAALDVAGDAAPDGAPIGVSALARVVFGVAGCGRPADRERLAVLVADQLGMTPDAVRVVTDVALLLPAADLSAGVALVAGTGSAAFGVAPDGRTASAGGWGYLVGDDGSAFDVGRRALRAVLRADDGFGPPTRLTDATKRALDVTQPRDLIRVLYQAPSPRVAIADLAPLVIAAARDGDGVASQIVGRAGALLGQIAGAVARRLGLGTDAVVVCTGGLFQAGELILDPLRRSLARSGPRDLRLLDREPALGALRLARGESVSRGGT